MDTQTAATPSPAFQMQRGKAALLRKVFVAIMGALIGLAIGSHYYYKASLKELVQPLALRNTATRPEVPTWIEGDYPLQDDKEIGFVARQNASTLRHDSNGLTYYLFTDGRGARRNLPTATRPSHCDIVTIGCSFSWGHGIENEYTYSTIIERKTGLSVENFSMGSYGTVQSLLLLHRNRDLRPRYVIYGWIDSHLNRNLSPLALRSEKPMILWMRI